MAVTKSHRLNDSLIFFVLYVFELLLMVVYYLSVPKYDFRTCTCFSMNLQIFSDALSKPALIRRKTNIKPIIRNHSHIENAISVTITAVSLSSVMKGICIAARINP